MDFPIVSPQAKLGLGLFAFAVVTVCVAYHFIIVSDLRSDIANQKSMVAERDSRISKLETTNHDMSKDIQAQNDAIDTFIKESQVFSKNTTAALIEYAKTNAAQKSTIDQLKNQKSTGDVSKDCELLNQNFEAEVIRRGL